jgi:hypothetical protein
MAIQKSHVLVQTLTKPKLQRKSNYMWQVVGCKALLIEEKKLQELRPHLFQLCSSCLFVVLPFRCLKKPSLA